MKFLIKSIVIIAITIFSICVYSASHSKVKYATVVFPGGHIFQLEIASTPEQWVKGLMFRKFLPKNSGMLFLYPKEDYYAIWMKNCFISLDLIWLDSKGRVVYIVESAPPCREEPCTVYEPMMKAKFVIELNAGTVKKLRLKLGDRISIILPKK